MISKINLELILEDMVRNGELESVKEKGEGFWISISKRNKLLVYN